jgi:hypothetical protein
MPTRYKPHQIKRINKANGDDPDEYELRLNDHVLVEWTVDPPEEGRPENLINAYVVIEMGDASISMYIVGLTDTEPLSEWILHDIYTRFGTDPKNPVYSHEEENIDVRVGYMPTLMTWLKLAKEKGAFT